MKKCNFIYMLICFLPWLDLITSLQTRVNPNGISIGMIIKGFIALVAGIYIVFYSSSKYKKISYWYLGLIICFLLLYFGCKPELLDCKFFLYEAKYLFRMLFMPIIFCFLLNYFDEYGFDKKKYIKTMRFVLIEFAVLLLIPLLLNVAYDSYSTGLSGYVGWFYAANELSVIMVILLPFIYSFLNGRNKYNFFVAFPVLYAIACIGTKATFLGAIIAVLLGLLFILIENKFKRNNYTVGAFIILLFTIFLFGFSKNLAIKNMQTLADKQDFVFIETPVVEQDRPSDSMNSTEDHQTPENINKPSNEGNNINKPSSEGNNINKSDSGKETPSLLSKVIVFLLSNRNDYFLQTNDIYQKTYRNYYPIVGMGFSNTNKINNANIDKLIEIDYLDLYYHTGILGLTIVCLPYIYVAVLVIKRLVKGKLNLQQTCAIFYNSLIICMALGIAAIAGHVLYYPAVSVYLALYLVYLMYLCDRFQKKEIKDNKVNILALHLNYGGIERVICNQANMLSNDFHVEILCLYNSHKHIPFKFNKNIKITYLLDEISNRSELLYAIKKFNIIKIWKESLKAIKILYLKPLVIKKAIQNSDAKIIISTRKEFSKILGKYHRDGVVTISEEHNHHKNNKKIIREVVKYNKKVDYLLPASKELADFYKNKVFAKIEYIPNVIDFYPPKENGLKTKKLVAIGRLSKEKGFIDLIPVMKELIKKDSSITLDIYGDGEEKESILKTIKDNDLSNNIFLKGFETPENLRRILVDYSILLCSSYEESFGIAILEAMSFGIPCVMFDDAKGPREFVNENTGIIISNRNAILMADKIFELLSNKKCLTVLGKNSRLKSLEYSIENIQKDFINFIKKVIVEKENKDKNIMFISSSGGHLNELCQLEKIFYKYNYSLITEKTKTTKSLKEKHKGRCGYLLFGTKHHMISYFLWVLPMNCFISLYYYIKYHPKCIITTGAHTAGPMCLIGKLFGSKVIFIESFANIHSKSITGRILYKFSDLFIVQWESMLEEYPNAMYGGWIY